MAATKKRKSVKAGFQVKIKPESSSKALESLADELVDPIRSQLPREKLNEMKEKLGHEIGKIKIASLHGKLTGQLGHVAGGYECKLWEKACC